jgi:hypothetical protein
MSTEPEAAEVTTVAVAGRAVVVSERLSEVKNEISSRFIEMGRLLLEAYQNNYARELGYNSFEAFVEDRLHMSYRKARYLAETVNVFISEFQIPEEEINALGWTKAKELIPAIKGGTVENAREWMEKAKTLKTSEINLEVRKSQAPPGQAEDLQRYDTLGIGVFEDEKIIIERAIELAKREGATIRPGRALMLICAEYAAEAEARHEEQIANPTAPDQTI